MSIAKDMEEIKIAMASLTAKVGEFMNTTTDFRKTLTADVKEISNKVIGLPCRERKGWYNSMSKQVSWLWKVCGAIALALAIGFFTHILK